ncbi:MAG TPA: hypothetical protein VJO99_14185 [Burkholderiaceae bacterium]|nr:hypothetical protein [Burkholderiaceae bacterium]
MNHATDERPLTTADLAAATDRAQRERAAQQEDLRESAESIEGRNARADRDEERQLAPLFMPEAAEDFRSRWDAIQIGFVDDPNLAVRSADELVAQVMKSLAETFSRERTELEAQFKETEDTSTENLRIALCRYRSFFQRLLSL